MAVHAFMVYGFNSLCISVMHKMTQFIFLLGPTLIGILPYAGLKFYVYEELKRHVPEEQQTSILMRLSCGAIAGLLGQTFTYPLDVVRRQMQVSPITHSDMAI